MNETVDNGVAGTCSSLPEPAGPLRSVTDRFRTSVSPDKKKTPEFPRLTGLFSVCGSDFPKLSRGRDQFHGARFSEATLKPEWESIPRKCARFPRANNRVTQNGQTLGNSVPFELPENVMEMDYELHVTRGNFRE